MAGSWTSAIVCSAMLAVLTGRTAPGLADDYIVNARNALPYPPGTTAPFEQCGPQDESEDVELYDGKLGVTRAYVDANEASTAMMQWAPRSAFLAKLPNYNPGTVAGVKWCTGTLLGGDYFLTAGHCLDVHENPNNSPREWKTPFTRGPNGKPLFAKPKVLATLQVVNFKYQLDSFNVQRTPDVYPVIELVEYRQGPDKLDYAVLKLGPNSAGKLPSQTYPVAKLAKHALKKDDVLAVMQHPDGRPKKIDAGTLYKEKGSALFYSDIDTLGGSSGAGIRDAAGDIVGVHTNGGCTPTGGANRGVSLSAISQVSNVLH